MYSEMMRYRSQKRHVEDTSDLDAKELSKTYDELLRRLTTARDELVKYKTDLDLFTPWMEKARKKLMEKEKYLTDFHKIDINFESTTDFVTDVIHHQTNLNSITQHAKNFIDHFRSYAEHSNKFRMTITPKKQARIESLSEMENELSDTVASISSKYRNLLTGVHALLSNELSGITVVQQKYKEAVNLAGTWLKEAERRANSILSEPIAVDIDTLEERMSCARALNDEFISQGNLVDNAKKILGTFLKSLEGQLSSDQMNDVKTPFVDIETKYHRLCQELSEKCGTLGIALAHLKSRLAQKTLSTFISKPDTSMNESNAPQISAEFSQSQMEKDVNEKLESSSNENNEQATSGSESTLLKSTEEFSRNDLEKKTDFESGAPVCKKIDTECSREVDSLSDEKKDLEEGECSSSEDRDDSFEKVITVGSEENQANSECNLLRDTDEISEDSFASDEDDQKQIRVIPKISTNKNEEGCSRECVLLNGTEEVSEESLMGDENGVEETVAIIRTPISENEDTAGHEYISLNGTGAEVLSEQSSKVNEAVLEEDIRTVTEMPNSDHTIVMSQECVTLQARDGLNNEHASKSDEPVCENIPEAEDETLQDSLNKTRNDLAEGIHTSLETQTSGLTSQKSISLQVQEEIPPDILDDENGPRTDTTTCGHADVEFNTESTPLESREEVFQNHLIEENSLNPETPVTESKIDAAPESNSYEAVAEFLAEKPPVSDQQSVSENQEPTTVSHEYVEEGDRRSESTNEANPLADSPLEAAEKLSRDDSEVEIGARLRTSIDDQSIIESDTNLEEVRSKLDTSVSEDMDVDFNAETASLEARNEFLRENLEREINPVVEILTNEQAVETSTECVSLAAVAVDEISNNQLFETSASEMMNSGSGAECSSSGVSAELPPRGSREEIIEELLMKHLITCQPVILLEDAGKTLKKTRSQRKRRSRLSQNSKLKSPKPLEISTNPYKKNSIGGPPTRKCSKPKKKTFKVNINQHPNSILHDYCSHHKLGSPIYNYEQKHEANQTFFLVSVTVKGKTYAAKATTKRKGKLQAVESCLQDLGLLPA